MIIPRTPYSLTDEVPDVSSIHVFVVGAGGLGCEILKSLVYSGYRRITVIDMDHIELSNLNRQFLFREEHVGRPKAEVAAEEINRRGFNVVGVVGKLQDLDPSFYDDVGIVISGLDNVEARRYLNAVLFDCLEFDDDNQPTQDSIKPMIDGGTEAMRGQVRVIIPGVTSCFECSLGLFPPQTRFPICTITETPRSPEHCIEYVMFVTWPKLRPDETLDTDDESHITWLCDNAKRRAALFGIEGVDSFLTLGVAKNVIPAVATTNSIIANALVTEALKLTTGCGIYLDNFASYAGDDGVYSYSFSYDKDPNCLVCSRGRTNLTFPSTATFKDVYDSIKESCGLETPSIFWDKGRLLMQKPKQLWDQTSPNLEKTIAQLFGDSTVVDMTVTDPAIATSVIVELKIS